MSSVLKRQNKRRVWEGHLCVTGRLGETISSLWKKGQAVKLAVAGTDVALEGFVR